MSKKLLALTLALLAIIIALVVVSNVFGLAERMADITAILIVAKGFIALGTTFAAIIALKVGSHQWCSDVPDNGIIGALVENSESDWIGCCGLLDGAFFVFALAQALTGMMNPWWVLACLGISVLFLSALTVYSAEKEGTYSIRECLREANEEDQKRRKADAEALRFGYKAKAEAESASSK